MSKTVVAVYTGQGLAEIVRKIFAEVLPGHRLFNIIDDSLIAEVVANGGVTPGVKKRLEQYFRHAVEIGADVVLNTCSSVGEVVDEVKSRFEVPIVKIDEAMATDAVTHYGRIGVIATLPTTLGPTKRLLQRQAETLGKQPVIVDGLAEGAYQALVQGQPEKHDDLIRQTAAGLSGQVDAFVLAQGSMARMQKQLEEETGKPVLSSPILALKKIADMLQ